MALWNSKQATHLPSASFIEDIIELCKMLNPHRKPPFIADGQFLYVARAAVRKATNFVVMQGSCNDNDIQLIVRDGFMNACHTLKINQVPWSEPPVPGRRGAPCTHVIYNMWMSLGAKNPRGPPTSAAIRAHDHTPMAIARRMSQNIIA
ncbi:hypothetical protein JVT61DRAFT_1889 [Boletus reticuloceps]|uniref:Uncharacterized protein n=1 Tax=Boletus reticuloceps TaxID=495285 RepID=A0A8I2YBX6_9AGAM|nr:hypothetical protein JVT61DRAFT_1889 [Boletus reticuloceps]